MARFFLQHDICIIPSTSVARNANGHGIRNVLRPTLMMPAMVFLAHKSRSTCRFVCTQHYVDKHYRYVETEYKLEIGAAQNTQLSKALGTGTEKGIFVLPKGL